MLDSMLVPNAQKQRRSFEQGERDLIKVQESVKEREREREREREKECGPLELIKSVGHWS